MSVSHSTIDVTVLIIGAGISGIGAAIRLREMGITDFVVLEKASSPGGTWRDNTYPGCACDVPSSLYSYSFAPNPRWSRVFARQPEILDYVHDVVDRFDVRPHIRFGEPALDGHWHEASGRWRVKTERGIYHARFVISCAGYLHEPQLPAIPGLEDFDGPLFHSSRWDHDLDLAGKCVGVIGTGASAIQFVPEIRKTAHQVVIYQRTPQWILPKTDSRLGDWAQQLMESPALSSLTRKALHSGLEAFGVGFRHPKLLEQIQKVALAHLHATIRDPELRQKLTPDYVLGCKRVLLSNDYYPAVRQQNVELLATGVERCAGKTLVGSDGSRRKADAIIMATGFHVSDPPNLDRVYGAEGRSLAEVWDGSPQAYRGTTVSGFPNLFLVLGPNLAIGNNSAFLVIEAQLKYIAATLAHLRDNRLTRFEVSAQAQKSYNLKVQNDLQRTVWNTGGCSSYYLDSNGLNSIGFPWSTQTMQRLLKKFDAGNYHLS